LKAAGCDVIRAEKASGTRRRSRTELQVLLDFLRQGDILVVTRVDCLARSIRDLQDIVHELWDRGVSHKAAMAKAVGVILRAVQRLWEAHRLQPHRIRTFKRSNDPEFAEKVEDIVGLYMDRPSTRWSSRSTRRAKSRRSTARNRACRLSPENAGDDP
jgi:hypothetical protein